MITTRKIFLRIVQTLILTWYLCPSLHAQELQGIFEQISRYKNLNNKEGLYEAYLQTGNIYNRDSVYSKAVEYYRKASQQARVIGKVEEDQFCRKLIAKALLESGQYLLAIEEYEQLLVEHEHYGDKTAEKYTLTQLTKLYKRNNNMEASLIYNERLLVLSQQSADKHSEVNAYNNLGVIYDIKGDTEHASQYFEKAKQVSKAASLNPEEETMLLLNIGYHYASMGDFSAARRNYQNALLVSENAKHYEGNAMCNNSLAALSFLEKKYEVAIHQASQALKIAQKYQSIPQEAEANLILSRLYEATQDTRKSREFYKKHLELKEILEAKERQGNASMMQRQLDAQQEEHDIKLLLSEKEKQALELKQLTLAAEKKERELELNKQQLQLLRQDKVLQEKILANQQLEQKRIALQKDKMQQDLLFAKKALENTEQQRHIDSLQKSQQLETLAKKEQAQELALLKASSDLQQQQIQQQESNKVFNRLLAVLFGALLLITLIWLYQKQRSNEKLKQSEADILHKNEELQSSEEELRQNAEELLAVNERVEQGRLKAEKTLAELQAAKDQIVQSEKMASLGQLTAGVAHEINNPINFVSGGAQTLHVLMEDLASLLALYSQLDKASTQEESVKAKAAIAAFERDVAPRDELVEDALAMLADIEIGATRVSEIVLGLRNFSRSDNSQQMNDHLHDNLNNTLLILHSKYHGRVEIIKDYDPKIKYIECYPGQLSQVFINIIGNSIDAIEGKGAIQIITRHLGEHIEIVLKDNGNGMPEEVRSRIFDPFFTTKEVGKGTGLGLSIVHGIIEKHHGNIEVKSEIGKGTSFIILLPV